MNTEGTGERGGVPMDIDQDQVLGTSAESLAAPAHTQMPPITPGPAQSEGEGTADSLSSASLPIASSEALLNVFSSDEMQCESESTMANASRGGGSTVESGQTPAVRSRHQPPSPRRALSRQNLQPHHSFIHTGSPRIPRAFPPSPNHNTC